MWETNLAQFFDSDCKVGAQQVRRMSGDTALAIGWRLRYNNRVCLFVCLFVNRKGFELLSASEVPLCRIALH